MMKARRFIVTYLAVVAAIPLAWAQGTPADLASTLEAQRTVCAEMAAEARRAVDHAQFQSELDRETAAHKAQLDASVYGIGHGRRQTAEYYAQQLQLIQSEQIARTETAVEAFAASERAIRECVIDLEERGKSEYVAFKQRSADKTVMEEAQALMSAWLANISEISASAPNGEDDSFNTWKAAKAHAEVASL